MERLLIVARLKEGAHEDRLRRCSAEGPPFDPEELGLHRHGAYMTAEKSFSLRSSRGRVDRQRHRRRFVDRC